MGLSFAERFLPWREKNASKKLGDAIAKGNIKAVQEYLKHKPKKFEYLLWGTHPDAPGQKVPQRAFGNPVELAQYVGQKELISVLVAAGYLDTQTPTHNTNFVR